MDNPLPRDGFFPNRLFWYFFDNIILTKYGINTKISSRGQGISSYFEEYKTKLHAFYKQDRYKQ